jgi:hypothetical protein
MPAVKHTEKCSSDIALLHLIDLACHDVLLLWAPSLASKNVVHPVHTDGFTLRTRHVKVVANHKLPKLVLIGGKRAHLFQLDHPGKRKNNYFNSVSTLIFYYKFLICSNCQ